MKDWAVAKIEEIAEINPRLPKGELSADMTVSFVPMAAVGAENGSINVSNTRTYYDVQKGYTTFKEGDVLFAKITPCMENGKMAIVPSVQNGHGFGSTEFHVLRPSSAIETRYLYYYISSKQFRMDAEHNMSGAVGQRRVTTPYLAACKIPLPPLPEQHRIVAKIEELFSELDKGIESLKTAREQLKVYRQALLKHAFEGKLTEKWREENTCVDVVGAKQVSSASPAFDLRGNRPVDQKQNKGQNQGEADETLASPLRKGSLRKSQKRISA